MPRESYLTWPSTGTSFTTSLVYKDDAVNSHLVNVEGKVIAIAIVFVVVEPEEPQDD